MHNYGITYILILISILLTLSIELMVNEECVSYTLFCRGSTLDAMCPLNCSTQTNT